MPRNSSGNMTRTNGTFSGDTVWAQQAGSADKKINSQRHDTHDQDMADEMTDSLSRSGKGGMLAPLDVNNNRVINVGDATAPTDAPALQQVVPWNTPASGQANTTGSAPLATGTDAQRPASPSTGDIRFNTDRNNPEVYKDGDWEELATETRDDYPPNHIDGLLLSDNSALPNTDLDISAGSARSDDDTANIVLSTGLTKKMIAFVEGDNAGCLESAPAVADTDYDFYAIAKDDGTADIFGTTKGTSPTLPTDFTKQRFIGRRATDSSGNLISNMTTQQRIDGQYYESEIETSSGGTTRDFRALPDGPDSMEINCNQVANTLTHNLQLQLGGDSGLDAAGTYFGSSTNFTATANHSTLFVLGNALTANIGYNGLFNFRRSDAAGQKYAYSGSLTGASAGGVYVSSGSKDLSSQAFSRGQLSVNTGGFVSNEIYITAFKAGAYAP